MECINTYCSGFLLVANKNVTKRIFIQMLNDIQIKFNI